MKEIPKSKVKKKDEHQSSKTMWMPRVDKAIRAREKLGVGIGSHSTGN